MEKRKGFVLSVLVFALASSVQSASSLPSPVEMDPVTAQDTSDCKPANTVLRGVVSTAVTKDPPKRKVVIMWRGYPIEFQVAERQPKKKRAALMGEANSGLGFIGIQFTIPDKKKGPEIKQVFPSMPALQAGLKVGDLIESVDGKCTKGRNSKGVVHMIVGKPGEPVVLVVRSGDNEGREVRMLRMDGNDIPDQEAKNTFGKTMEFE